MRYLTRAIPVVLLGAFLVLPSAADAQRRRGDPADREQLEQRIRAQMGRMMQERLGLDDAEAAQLSEVVASFDARRRELAVREQATRRRVDALARASAPEQEALQVVRLQAELRTEEAALFRAETDALLGILTARQVLQLQELREDLGRRIRDLRGGGRDGDGGSTRGPGPRPDGRNGARGPGADRAPA
jgi:hypothetical protein